MSRSQLLFDYIHHVAAQHRFEGKEKEATELVSGLRNLGMHGRDGDVMAWFVRITGVRFLPDEWQQVMRRNKEHYAKEYESGGCPWPGIAFPISRGMGDDHEVAYVQKDNTDDLYEDDLSAFVSLFRFLWRHHPSLIPVVDRWGCFFLSPRVGGMTCGFVQGMLYDFHKAQCEKTGAYLQPTKVGAPNVERELGHHTLSCFAGDWEAVWEPGEDTFDLWEWLPGQAAKCRGRSVAHPDLYKVERFEPLMEAMRKVKERHEPNVLKFLETHCFQCEHKKPACRCRPKHPAMSRRQDPPRIDSCGEITKIGVTSGRMQSKEPNLANVPRAKKKPVVLNDLVEAQTHYNPSEEIPMKTTQQPISSEMTTAMVLKRLKQVWPTAAAAFERIQAGGNYEVTPTAEELVAIRHDHQVAIDTVLREEIYAGVSKEALKAALINLTEGPNGRVRKLSYTFFKTVVERIEGYEKAKGRR